MSSRIFLLDTNAIIEAVRTGIWNALAGSLTIETVEECREECLRGDTLSTGHIVVSPEQLARIVTIHAVTESQRAAFLLKEHASSLDDGERDLYAHALARSDNPTWFVCSPDRAAVRCGVALGWADRLVSLEGVQKAAGARPNPNLRAHFTSRWLSQERTKAMLGA